MSPHGSREVFFEAQRTRFDELVARKTAAAQAAQLPPLVTDADDAGDDLLPVGNAWTHRQFDGDFYLSRVPGGTRPACSLVFVQSLDGNTGASNPQTLGGGETDKHLIYEGLSQVDADAVLAGAGTIAGEDIVFGVWHPELVRLRRALGKPRFPTQVVATLEGLALDAHLLFNLPGIPVFVLTREDGARRMQAGLAERPWVTPIVMPQTDALPFAFESLRKAGIERISCVGGRHLATQVIDAGLIQDLYLTTSPKPGGEPNTPFYPRPLPWRTVVRKHGTGVETGVVFEHHLL
jgi:riboflavin biosynthesis pyrimidine reductase